MKRTEEHPVSDDAIDTTRYSPEAVRRRRLLTGIGLAVVLAVGGVLHAVGVLPPG